MNDVANRERGSDLFEIHDKMQQNGKEMEGIVNKLLSISEKLEVTEHEKVKETGDLPGVLKRPPGRITDLYLDSDGWKQLNQRLGAICAKMERLL